MQEKKNPPKNEKNLREREITFLCGKTKNQDRMREKLTNLIIVKW